MRAGINSLASDGFRNIILVSPYDLSKSSAFELFGSGDATTLSLASQYSVAIRNQLATLSTPGVNIYYMDALTLLNRIQATPALYGFDHVTSADSCSASAACLAAPVAVQNRYVFNDFIHTTSGFDGLMSNYIGNIINARDGLGAQGDLAESSGRTFSATLLDRLDATRRMNASFASYAMNARAQAYPAKAAPKTAQIQTDSPLSVFVQGGAASVDRSNIVTSTGNIDAGINTNFAAVTAGIEYRVNPNLLAGGAFNYTNAETTLPGLSRTHVAFDSFQGAVYASLSHTNFFVDGVLTYGSNNYDLRRPGVIDFLTATPSGNTFTATGKAGYLFDVATIKAGPIAQLTYVNVRVGGYQENGDDLLTLGVRNQSFDGLTGSAGIQIRTTMATFGGMLSPYVNLTAEHDFLDGVRTITSFSTIAPALLINTSAGRPNDDTYGKIAGGFNLDFSRGVSAQFNASTTFGRSYGDSYAVNGGLKYQF